jgi:hypothetical protein
MKASLRRVPNKLGYNSVTRAKLKKAGAVPFTEVSKFLSTGETNVVYLDLTGKPVPVSADALGTRRVANRKKASERLTKLERTLRRLIEMHDIDPSEVKGVALLVGEETEKAEQHYYIPKTL